MDQDLDYFATRILFRKDSLSRLGRPENDLNAKIRGFNISAEFFCLFLSSLPYRILKNGRLSGASFQHSLSKDQYSSGDSNSLADSQKVMRKMLPGDPRSSPAS